MATTAKTRPATGGASTTKKAAAAPAATPEKPATLGAGLKSLFMGNTAQGGTRPQTPGMGRFFMGMMIYLFVSYLMQFVLAVLNVKVFHYALTNTVLIRKLPLLGDLNVMSLIFILILVGVLWGLYKFKILPSNADLRAQGQAMAAQRAGAKGATAAKSGAAAKNAVTGKSSVTTKNAAVKKSATARPTSTGKLAAAGADAKGAKVAEPGENDDLYAQVRAQRLAAARKARKR